MSQAITMMLKTIFPTKISFEEYIASLGLTGEFAIIVGDTLYDQYCNSNVRYDTEDAFKRHFGITLKNIYSRYEREHNVINKIYKISDEDLQIISTSINVNSDNDNSFVDNPLSKLVAFVTNKQISQHTKNSLDAYFDAIGKMADDVLEDLIDDVRKHFMHVIEPYGYYFCDEEV